MPQPEGKPWLRANAPYIRAVENRQQWERWDPGEGGGGWQWRRGEGVAEEDTLVGSGGDGAVRNGAGGDS